MHSHFGRAARLALGFASLLALVPAAAARQNHPPLAPTITEPSMNGQVVNPADVHMETAPFSDPDPGDQHFCSDWEIWTVTPSERVWFADCITGLERVHIHLADGMFEGSHFGRTELFENRAYTLRVRHSDDSGDPTTRWSPYSTRAFTTGDSLTVFPLEIEDVADAPAPAWSFATGGGAPILPGGASPGWVRVESATGSLLLEIKGLDGTQNVVTNPAELPSHRPVRVRVHAGSAALSLAPSDLALFDEHCESHRLLFPAVALSPSQDVQYWISSTGASYAGTNGSTTPTFGNLLRALSPPWHARQPGYRVGVFASGFQLPVNIAFVPHAAPQPSAPFFYVTELYGKIVVVRRDGTTGDFATNLLNFNPTGAFPGSGEQGVAGIVVDPMNGDVYASMLYASAVTPSVHYPKVVRFTSVDGGQTAATQTTVIDMFGESQGQSHQISNLSFGPDDKLYVHMGDGFNSATAQNLDSFRGKILRMERDGTPANDNPFYNASDGINARDYVFAYGLRNPFGGAWRQSDGKHYEVENGPSVDRIAQIVAGRNYLWNGSDASMTNFAIWNWAPAVGPVNVAFVQNATYHGSDFPAEKLDHAFISESGPTWANGTQQNGKRITEWVFDGSGGLVAGPIPFVEYAGAGRATAVGLAAGPDGLYFSELYRDDGATPTQAGARILRVSFDASFDCNGDGVEDACAIASGASPDTNGNGVPDDCDCAGVRFCQATPNSTGVQARIASNGSCDVAANDLVLSAEPVPNQPGIFFYGTNRVNGGAGAPFLNGFRCVGGGGSVFRLHPMTATGNVASLALDLTHPPLPAGQILPGSTWHFQYWFRDPAAGGAGANLSDGLSIHFQ